MIKITISKRAIRTTLALSVSLIAFVLFQNAAPAVNSTAQNGCSEDKVKELLTKSKGEVVLQCKFNIKLKESDTISRRVVIQGAESSGSVLDCGGGSIDAGPDVRSKVIQIRSVQSKTDPEIWYRPSNIVIRNCRIHGATRVYGLSLNTGEPVVEASRRKDFTSYAQSTAPTGIHLENLHITSYDSQNTIYFSTGVTYSSLRNSVIDGTGASAIYLESESYGNVVENNNFKFKSVPCDGCRSGREVIAIDGSAANLIVGNKINNATGGVNIYRNCGEKGAIRHQKPRYNKIINNIFTKDAVAVYVGSRNPVNPTYYCGYDKGYSYGSSADDSDNAKHNVVMQNQFLKRSPAAAVLMTEKPNYVGENKQVSVPVVRKSGCFYKNGNDIKFHNDGDSREFNGVKKICAEARWIKPSTIVAQKTTAREPAAEVTQKNKKVIDVNCAVTGDSKGCLKAVSCPEKLKATSVRVSCNLEWSKIDESQFLKSAWNELTVLRASDVVKSGLCQVSSPNEEINSTKAKRDLASLVGNTQFQFFCRETDSNGGDCHLRAQVVCE